MKRKLSIVFGILLVCVLMLSLTIGCTSTTTPAATKVFKVGVIYSLTGPGSEVEKPMANASTMVNKWFNEQGGLTINGEKYQVEIIMEDQKSTIDGALAAVNKLIYQDNVKFIIGQMVPDVTLAVAPVCEKAQVLRSNAWGCIPGVLTPETQYCFKVVIGGDQTIEQIYKYLVSAYPNVKTISQVNPDEAGGQYNMPVIKKVAEANGIKVLTQEFYPFSTEDFYPVVTKVLAPKPDGFDMGAGFPNWAASMIKASREMGFKGPMWSPTSAWDLYLIKSIIGEKDATDVFNPFLDFNSPNAPKMVKDIKAMWDKDYPGQNFVYENIFAWDAYWCCMQAIQKAQSFDPTKVKETWENMSSIQTAHGEGHMGGLKTYGVNHQVVHPFAISRLNNGNVELAKMVNLDIP